MAQAAPMEKTRTPGIYRRGARYAYTYRDRQGRQRWGSERTLAEARTAKADAERAARSGAADAGRRVSLHRWLDEWIERYQGTGRRGFREETRAEYRFDLERYAKRFWSPRTRLTEIDARAAAQFVAWLVKQSNGRGGTLSDASVRNKLAPMRAAMNTARAEGMVAANPFDGVQLPYRPRIRDEARDRRALSDEQLAMFLELVHPDHRLMLALAASTGMRASEIIGLDVRHLHLQGARPHVKVRQRYRDGRVGAVKSTHGGRDIPLADDLVGPLRELVRDRAPASPLFTTLAGGRLDRDNILKRVIRPAAEELGQPWVGWHTLRHTCASRLFRRGRNAKQVQRWLGHSSASFTLDTYVHLLDGGMGEGLSLPLTRHDFHEDIAEGEDQETQEAC